MSKDDVQMTAYLEELLEAERENVRVLREAAEAVCDATCYGHCVDYTCEPEVKALARALATTAPEGGEV